MPNPYLPLWEYIPDGEPRVFGDRIYIYGSHDNAGASDFCDHVLKCWSAPLSAPDRWVCHGDIFRTLPRGERPSDTDWTDASNYLYAPDVVEKDGKYYLYAYIVNSVGCVAVSDRPEGPFRLLSKYSYTIPDEICCNGWFIDPGVLVDDDGRTYIYCGYERSFMAEINSDNMYEVLDGSCIEHIIPCELSEEAAARGFDTPDKLFFEACSPRKVGDTYYLIYSPKRGSRLAYATSDKPTGPFTYGGWIVDNGDRYPGGNDHGSIACVNGQWYIFYHRMTNGTIMSRRGCVERIEILPDGSVPPVEMTSLGFEQSLDPYRITPAELACVLEGGAFITEKSVFERVVTNITEGCVIGYRYFDFGEDNGGNTDVEKPSPKRGKDAAQQSANDRERSTCGGMMELAVNVGGMGCDCTLDVFIDGTEDKIGSVAVGKNDAALTAEVRAVSGRHSVFFKVSTDYPDDWRGESFKNRPLFELKSFVFMK